MEAVIFAEGNGYGHAARSRLLAEHLDIPMITFGKGAEYCRQHGLDFVEIPEPYRIGTVRDKVRIITNVRGLLQYLKPSATAAMKEHFRKADLVIVDGSYFGLALAMLMKKRAIFITNDTASLVGIQGAIQRKAAASLGNQLLRYPERIIVPDFPPPLTATMLNLDPTVPMVFTGPLARPARQRRHNKRFLVAGSLEKMIRPILGESAIYGSEVREFSSCYRDAELVFTHAGHSTIMEALGMGKPLVCVTSKEHHERYRNAMRLSEMDVGILLDEEQVSADSVRLAIEYAKTLNRERLALYKKAMRRIGPFERMLSLKP